MRRRELTFNLVGLLPTLDAAGVNDDLMFVTTGTRRMWPLRNTGPLVDEYSLTADQENVWLTGGSEADVIAEAHLDSTSILAAVQRFANERPKRIGRQKALIDRLS